MTDELLDATAHLAPAVRVSASRSRARCVVEPDIDALADATRPMPPRSRSPRRIDARGHANVMFATGQLAARLPRPAHRPTRRSTWSRVTGFHMDEYVGIAADHPASFARYMRERIVARRAIRRRSTTSTAPRRPRGRVPPVRRAARARIRSTSAVSASARTATSRSTTRRSPTSPTRVAVKVVALDDACRRQQVGEGHFPDVDAVPPHRDHGDDPRAARARRRCWRSCPRRARRRRCATRSTAR